MAVTDEEALLRFNDKAIAFPRAAEACLRAIVARSELTIGSLPGDDRLAVCTTLVKEGFLTIVA